MRHNTAVEQFSESGFTAYLYPDTDPSNPRADQDNFGRMVCWHQRYTLSDEPNFLYNGKRHSETWDSPQDFQEWADAQNGIVVLPLYLYDHGGITMSTGAFSCPWDSGQVGYIYATREMILENWGRKRLDKKLIVRAEELLKAEVETFDQYLTGQVYGYVVENPDGGEVDSCWGFYGEKYAEEEAKSALAGAVADAKVAHTAELQREADAPGDVPIDGGAA